MRRIAGGLAGVVAFGVVQYAWDRAAAVAGWWSYPGYNTTSSMPMPAAIYLFSGLVYAGFGLIGWRITRRYSWKGLLAFLVAWSLWGFLHDTVGSSLFSSSQLMVIGTGAAPLIADFLVYATCMAAVLATIRWIGGTFSSGCIGAYSKLDLQTGEDYLYLEALGQSFGFRDSQVLRGFHVRVSPPARPTLLG